jgi:sugar O-acyltransferase (sialic acid O-acetyltransferase NeuD family)
MKEELYIVGAGSVGGHLALNIEDYTDEFEIVGFFDDDPEKVGSEQFGFPVIGPVDDVLKLTEVGVAIGIAFPKVKQRIFNKLSSNSSLLYPSLIHNKAWVSREVLVGKGCIIYPGTMINYGSDIRDFACINMNCSLGHHTIVGAFSSLAPGVKTGGHTIIEEEVDMGIGSSTIQDIRIENGSTVGGQSMVTQNVASETTVVGIPSRVIS